MTPNVVEQCPEEVGVEACFGSHNDTAYQSTDLKQTWRLWMFQVCTQWGYFMPAHTDGPSLLSKRYVPAIHWTSNHAAADAEESPSTTRPRSANKPTHQASTLASPNGPTWTRSTGGAIMLLKQIGWRLSMGIGIRGAPW